MFNGDRKEHCKKDCSIVNYMYIVMTFPFLSNAYEGGGDGKM